MPNNDLPVTVDEVQNPAGASDAPQRTTAPETEASAQATPALDLRGYELSERLGGGGMGDVYRAADPALGRDLAVKVMKVELQGYAAAEQRFLREARVTGSLQHPGIVPIYNLGRLADGRLHYTMRLVRGRTFADILRDEAGQAERLPALLAIFEKICQAVAYAHSKGVLHRDLKPANVMVGRFGEVQVMDWGLAKHLTAKEAPTAPEAAADVDGTRIHTEASELSTEHTAMGREMGTPAYMPPEQALGEWDTVDERADVFALGAILCEILTSRPPYLGHDREEVLRKAKRGELAEAFARLGRCGADASLLVLCQKCLTPAREGRPRDAEEVAQQVAAYQAEVQERLSRTELERAAAVVQTREERKKRRWILAAALFLLAGVAGSTWFALWARKAEGLAQTRLNQIEKANEVLTSIFRDLDPRAEEKGGPSLNQQLSQHLEGAAAQLDEAAVGDPLAVARLQTTLGESLTNLDQDKLAIEVLNKAVRTLEAKLGPDHPDTLNCRNNLANAYFGAGHTIEAIRLHEQVLKQYEAKRGVDHPKTLTSRNNLAMAYLVAARTDEAIRLHEQNLPLREAKLGADHAQTLKSGKNLADAYLDAGRTAEAIHLPEQTLKKSEAKLGPDHFDTLLSRDNLALAYLAANRTAEAIHLNEQNLKQYEAKFGPDRPGTLFSRNNLALAYQHAGRNAEAIRLHERNLPLMEAKLGSDHPQTLRSRLCLASTYEEAFRIDDAIRLYEQNLKLSEAKLGADHPDTLKTRNGLGMTYWYAGRAAEAVPLHEKTLKQREDKLGPYHRDTITSRNNLAIAYNSVGRSAEAARLHELNLKERESKLGPDHLHTLLSRANLGTAYRDSGRPKEAIPLLETALERGRKLSGGLPASLSWISGELAVTYDRAGLFAKAESIYRDSLKQARRQFGPVDLRTANTLILLGSNQLKQKRFSEAEPLLRESLTICVKQQPDMWTTFNARSVLGEALLGQKKYTEAETLLVQGYEGIKQRQNKILPAYRQLRLSEAIERLVRLYVATGQKDKVAEWQKKLQEAEAAQKITKP